LPRCDLLRLSLKLGGFVRPVSWTGGPRTHDKPEDVGKLSGGVIRALDTLTHGTMFKMMNQFVADRGEWKPHIHIYKYKCETRHTIKLTRTKTRTKDTKDTERESEWRKEIANELVTEGTLTNLYYIVYD